MHGQHLLGGRRRFAGPVDDAPEVQSRVVGTEHLARHRRPSPGHERLQMRDVITRTKARTFASLEVLSASA